MITIGQLARHVGVTTKTIRVYHQKGLLREPARDASGYRRYTAQHAVELVKIRTLAVAGVPLAEIASLLAGTDQDLQDAVQRIDKDISARIRLLRHTQHRLQNLATGARHHLLPAEVNNHLESLPARGFTSRWIELETDLWILVFATHPETAIALFHDQAEALRDPNLRQLYLDYDHAHDLDPKDPRLADLANRIVKASGTRYDPEGPPGPAGESPIPALIQSAVNDLSPAWQQLDHLIRTQLQV